MVVTITVSGTSVETTLFDQPKTSPSPTAMATTAPRVRTMAARARHERYTRNTKVMRKIPKSGMNFFVDSPVWRSSQASSQGVPTRRMAVKGAAGVLERQHQRIDGRQCTVARLRGLDLELQPDTQEVIAQQTRAAKQRRARGEGAQPVRVAGADRRGRRPRENTA